MRTGGDGESRGFMALAWAAQRGINIIFHFHPKALLSTVLEGFWWTVSNLHSVLGRSTKFVF